MPDSDELKKQWQTVNKTIVAGSEEIDQLLADMKPEVAANIGGVLGRVTNILRECGELVLLLKGLVK